MNNFRGRGMRSLQHVDTMLTLLKQTEIYWVSIIPILWCLSSLLAPLFRGVLIGFRNIYDLHTLGL